MKVTVLKNGNTTDYHFAPEHTSEVVGFYTKEYWAKGIQGFTATLENGETVTVGAN